jgi:hypothetical protein
MRISETEFKRMPERLQRMFVCEPTKSEVEAAFAAFGSKGGGFGTRGRNALGLVNDDGWRPSQEGQTVGFGDAGTASRFFYSAKASKADRAGSRHPTVKPVALMRWLVRMVTPPGGTVLDPFAGSGTTLAAAALEGFAAIGIEQEAEYIADIHHRLDGMREVEAARPVREVAKSARKPAKRPEPKSEPEDLPPLLAAMAAE